ncbi:UvrABC system protein B [Dictyobacter vulcani]|uniref:UvrABC system protein B n=1 Tax=Dictyobacter vulcani TaxID=2607529 RepID=A0A5J4KKB2_9CHLR|nr:excinuclease ABC subunit UvrB [Dictyobacter vulcani]GER86611.1 UvrABC system protein B [Dictyobacter vulcani]
MPAFKVEAPFEPTGDQPEAINQLVKSITDGNKYQTLLGVTGSGKTYTVAKIVEQLQRPTLVLAPNKTLAAQLYSEYKEFFPNNAVEYFVSYYDYYQPEAYIARTDTYVEKESMLNEEIEKLRLSATRSLFERRDVLIVASVSCIYGLGSPEEYGQVVLTLKVGEERRRDKILRHLTEIQYERNDANFVRGRFRVRGDVLEIFPAYEDVAVRIEFFGDEIERMTDIDPLTGEILNKRQRLDIYPAKHWVTTRERLFKSIELIDAELEEQLKVFESEGKLLEAARLKQRTNFDMEMLRETGFCSGVENYSRHLAGRGSGEQPWTLLDYMPDDFLMVVDESHVALPQVRGMFAGDRSRKQVLVDYGFRLPSAMDNRPLTFPEFDGELNQSLYVSATPGPYEFEHSLQVVEQLIRPTGLIDPEISVRPTKGQIDDLIAEIRLRVEKKQRVLVTTLTKKMSEDLADYMQELNIKVHYLHSEIDTIERIEILRDLRLGVYDVVVGINLLREGLDLPEVSLVAILDADKEGFLRSEGSLIQIIGRAARHVEGKVIMYADRNTRSMQRAIDETNRRRKLQLAYNEEHNITPRGIQKEIKTLSERLKAMSGSEDKGNSKSPAAILAGIPKDEALRLIKDLESQMRTAAKQLEFEKAGQLRDQIIELRRSMIE